MAKFSERLRELRKERGLKQREMAEICGLKLRGYQQYEYNESYPEVPGLVALADFFGVSLDYLVGRDAGPAKAEPVRPGLYRHFKGKEYRVLYNAAHSETLEPLVVYQALYGERGVWVRPASMWSEHVERDGYSGPRFTYLGE